MSMIDLTPKCKKCGREIKLEEVFDPCPKCGYNNLKESCRVGQISAAKRLKELIRIQEENDKRMSAPDYEGPRFAGALA